MVTLSLLLLSFRQTWQEDKKTFDDEKQDLQRIMQKDLSQLGTQFLKSGLAEGNGT